MHCSNNQLYVRLAQFIKPNSTDEDDYNSFQAYHQIIKANQEEATFIKSQLRKAIQDKVPQQFFICAGYLAYLINYEHQFLDILEDERKQYMKQCLLSKNKSQKCQLSLAMLLTTEDGMDLLQIISGKVNNIQHTYQDDDSVWFYMKVIQKKMKFELVKKTKIIMRQNFKMNKLTEKIVVFACGKNHESNRVVSHYKVRLLSLLLLYQNSTIDGFQITISSAIERWLKMELLIEDFENSFYKLLRLSIQFLGIKNAEDLITFIFKNIGSIKNAEFIELMKTFFEKYIPETKINKPKVNEIAHRITLSLFDSHYPIECYNQKKKLIDISTTLSKLIDKNMGKQIMKMYYQQRNLSKKTLLVVINQIYQPKVSQQSILILEESYVPIFNQSIKHNKLQQELISYFCNQAFSFDDFMSNPEHTENILWLLLGIKATVKINMGLIEKCGLTGLIQNLIGFIFLDYYPEQSIDIIQSILILTKDKVFVQKLKDIQVNNLFKDVKVFMLQNIYNFSNTDLPQRIFKNISYILNKINQKCPLTEFSNVDFFNELIACISGLQPRFLTVKMIDYSSKLLKLSLPKDVNMGLDDSKRYSFNDCLDNLVILLKIKPNIPYLQIYIQAIKRSRQNSYVTEKITTLNEKMMNILQNQQKCIYQVWKDYYELNISMSINRQMEVEDIKRCWNFLSKFKEYMQFGFDYIFDYFFYSEHCILENRLSALSIDRNQFLEQFYSFQVNECMTISAEIDSMIKKAHICKQLQAYMKLKQALLLYLQPMLFKLMELNPNFQASNLQNYLMLQSEQMLFPDEILQFESPMMKKAKQYWCNQHITMLLMLPRLIKKDKFRRTQAYVESTIKKLESYFQHLIRQITQIDASVTNELELIFICQLQELRKN